MLIGTIDQWYQNDFGLSLQIINAFVGLIEPQREYIIQRYRGGKRTDFLEHDFGDDGLYGEEVVSYDGIDSLSCDVNAMFEEYFPNLLRRSAVITVCSYFEDDLFHLCDIFKNEKHLGESFSSSSGKGLDKATNYLQDVAKLRGLKDSTEWRNVRHICTFRNAFVHRGGRLKDSRGSIPLEMTAATENLNHWHGKEHIVLEDGFVPQAVAILQQYFKRIDDLIQAAAKRR